MNDLDITNIGTFIMDNENVIFSISVYKRLFTPYEEDKKFSDESIFQDSFDCKLISAIDTGGDILLKVRRCWEEYDELVFSNMYEYYSLMDIKLSERIKEDDPEYDANGSL